MAGNSENQSSSNPRRVLGDLTNQLGKRGGLATSDTSVLKSRSGSGRISNDETEDAHLAKKICLGVENTPRDKIGTNCAVTEEGASQSKSKQGNSFLCPSSGRGVLQIKPLSSILPEIMQTSVEQPVTVDAFSHDVLQMGNPLRDRDCCISAVKGHDGAARGNCVGAPGDAVYEELTSMSKIGEKELDDNTLSMNEDGSGDCDELTEPRGLKGFELLRCSGLSSSSSSDLRAGIDLIKNCSCSFCTKAAFMWSDLLYQDIKGRIAALKKSQKETAITVQRYSKNKDTNFHDNGNVQRSSDIESDLTGHWKTLFVHMENILARENNQLQSSFLALQSLRDNCKVNLGLVDDMPPERQKTVSDVSGE